MGRIGEYFKCQLCGEMTLQTGHSQKYCHDCRRKLHNKRCIEKQKKRRLEKSGVGKEFACEMCGKTIIRNSANHKFCSECKAKESVRIQRFTQCQLCGKTIQRKSNEKYCPDCRQEAYKKWMREHNKRRGAIYKEKTVVETEVITRPKFTLAEVEAAARANNMNYGKYVAMWKSGKVAPPEKIEKRRKRR